MALVGDARLVCLDGACNFRDLGGYPTRDGRLTRWARLFRSDALNELSGRDVALLRSMDLASVIDLRTPAEVARGGRGPLADEPVRYVNLSVLRREGEETRASPAPVGDELAERYLWYLEVGREAIVGVLRLLAEPSTYPAVVHCTAGKDRTGVLAALVLECLGVDGETIVRDYVRTAERMELIIDRLRRDPVNGAGVDRLRASRLRVEAVTMELFLKGLRQRYGGARAWALSAGVPAEELERLPALLLG